MSRLKINLTVSSSGRLGSSGLKEFIAEPLGSWQHSVVTLSEERKKKHGVVFAKTLYVTKYAFHLTSSGNNKAPYQSTIIRMTADSLLELKRFGYYSELLILHQGGGRLRVHSEGGRKRPKNCVLTWCMEPWVPWINLTEFLPPKTDRRDQDMRFQQGRGCGQM